MELELWIAFVAASAVLLAIPGPTVTVVAGHALGSGPRAAWAMVPGVVAGDFVAMTASLLGAGALLAASATLFTALKWVGAAYLIWLGIKLWRSRPNATLDGQAAPAQSQRAIFWNCFVVTALNPKDILFFVAFLPQFIDPTRPALLQFAILEITFLSMVAINIALWSLAAGKLRQRVARADRMRLMNRLGGGFLVSAGLLVTRA